MRYTIKERFFSVTDHFVIRNEAEEPVYQVKGRFLTLVDQLSFQDMEGNELAFIRQKIIALTATYQIFRTDKLTAMVHKKMFSVLRARFVVDVPGPGDLEATGNFSGHEFRFERDGQLVATVSKRWFTMTDTYGVEVADGEDDILILAATVAIDQALSERRN
jgi:uncharacterized protein YxjI